jgi:hypothetical protein
VQSDGAAGLARRLGRRLRSSPAWLSLNVFGHSGTTRVTSTSEVRNAAAAQGMRIQRLTRSDDRHLDRLLGIGPWGTPKSVLVRDLERGYTCYVVSDDRDLVAAAWTIVGVPFNDWALSRTFDLAPREAYYYRMFTVPKRRGSGIMALLSRYMMADGHERLGVVRSYAIVRRDNRSMAHVFENRGWARCGRVGYADLAGARLHFLMGRHAFAATRARVFVDFGMGTDDPD